MAVASSRPAVNTTAGGVLILDPGGDGDNIGASVVLKNVTGTASVFLGPSGVTTANGFEWAPADGPLSIDLGREEKLYGIVAVTTQTLHVLATGE